MFPSFFFIFTSFVHALTFRLYRLVADMLLFYKQTGRVAYIVVGVGVELFLARLLAVGLATGRLTYRSRQIRVTTRLLTLAFSNSVGCVAGITTL